MSGEHRPTIEQQATAALAYDFITDCSGRLYQWAREGYTDLPWVAALPAPGVNECGFRALARQFGYELE